MKSSKLVIVFSELWNDDQLALSKKSLLKGLEQLYKKVSNDNIFNGVEDCVVNENIKLENCDVEVILKAERGVVANAINEALKCDNTLVLYVGEVTVPFGHWILRDGLFQSNNLLEILHTERKDNNNFVFTTLSPCEDWQLVEKKQIESFSLCPYNLDDDEPVEFCSGISRFVDGILSLLTISHIKNEHSNSTATIVTRNPSLYVFLDKGSPAVPALLALDGFAMLFNFGFHKNPESIRYLKFYQQIDVGLLSHVGYNNLLGLSAYSADDSGLKINHLFLPGDVSVDTKVPTSTHTSFHVDLRAHLTTAVCELKNRGMQCSNLSIKAKSGAALSANNVKPVQLFHKIGYGSLEMIPLSPFEDDAEVKKFSDDWKKGKYPNDSLLKSLPSAVSVLIVWKPFSNKAAVKRILYVGSKCPIKRCFPTVIASLYGTYDFLKQADYVPCDGLAKKSAPRKTTPPVSAGTKPKAGDNVAASTTGAPPTKKPATTTEKGGRPSTAAPHSSKEEPTKRPQTVGSKPKPEVSKSVEVKKPATGTTKAAPAANKKPPAKKPEAKVPAKQAAHKAESRTKVDKAAKAVSSNHDDRNAHVVANGNDISVPAVANGNHSIEEITDVIGNGNHSTEQPTIDHREPLDQIKDVTSCKSDGGKIVAVGTVECAITEHGEADFCDDTPEELSMDQMREMGLYDDEDDEKVRPTVPAGDSHVGEAGIGNLAHLPMEGSFYGKETIDVNEAGNEHADWNQPLAMPMPAKDANAAAKKITKCPAQIHVDCLCVPCDLDKDDLRYLFECIKFKTAILQLDKTEDLIKSLDILLEERGKEGVTNGESTVIPAIADESLLVWASENSAKLQACLVKVPTDLSRCSLAAGCGDDGDSAETCQGMKLEF